MFVQSVIGWKCRQKGAAGTLTEVFTSFSKKPERSRHDDIPISWKALMRVGEPGSLSASDGCIKGIESRQLWHKLTNIPSVYINKALTYIPPCVLTRLRRLYVFLLHLLHLDLQECSPVWTIHLLWSPPLLSEFEDWDQGSSLIGSLPLGIAISVFEDPPWKSEFYPQERLKI